MTGHAADAPRPKPQLEMLWPESRLDAPPKVIIPAGYRLRVFGDTDADAHAELMRGAGFADWNLDKLKASLQRALPDGFFVIEHQPSGALVVTAMATHNPTGAHPYGGELGWVAGDPAHNGKGLGRAVCAAVVSRFLRAGYRRIYLKTDDWRLPAIKSYLKLGFAPHPFAPDSSAKASEPSEAIERRRTEMGERWRSVCEKLSWPFAPENRCCHAS